MTLERYWSDGSRDKTFVWQRRSTYGDSPVIVTEQIIVRGSDIDSCLPRIDDTRWTAASKHPPKQSQAG